MKRRYHTIENQGRANQRKLADLLVRNGEILLPMAELIEHLVSYGVNPTTRRLQCGLWSRHICTTLQKPQAAQRARAVTPGQAAVFYDGDLVLGGGWIE